MPNKRVFIALSFEDADLSTQFRDMYRKLKVTADKSELDTKWVPFQNLHLTLKFLGEITPQQEELAAVTLKQLCTQFTPFELKLRGVGAFPDELEARVIWVGAQNKVILGNVWEAIEQAFTALGFSPADQDFVPHITIARMRSKQSVKKLISPFLRKDYGKIIINKITLFESHLQGNIPVYKPIQSFAI